MKKIVLSFATLLALTAVFAFSIASSWNIKSDYSIKFSGEDASGIFKTFTGTINFDEKNLAASNFAVTIDVKSINTGNGMQNKHAIGAEWFDAAKYPSIVFNSSKIAKAGTGWQVTGTLEMRGVKKEITIPFAFVPKGNEAVFSGTFNVNRNDFGIGKPASGTAGVIKIEVYVPVTKK
ncbi:YceI family protein [Paraflavitalea sp. CAU 1676]|uniref:YceI family protein n=1 Tax=Paraflavitalea sp. CAU 1676 TaxID=3032598 RepID=UPI0023DB2AA6|nr:YceI family protein [Paraflavitalea sp. CAU 1676]MDF2192435.1 YceI family protein [Paraflavitalea sp. CAU 1676]